MWLRDSIPTRLVRSLHSSVVRLSFIHYIRRQMRWQRLSKASSIFTTLPLVLVIGLKLVYLPWRAFLLTSAITLHSWTSAGASQPSLARFLFFCWSLAGCFPLSYGDGWEGHEGFGKAWAGALTTLGTESVVRTRGGAVVTSFVLGVAQDRAP